MAAEPVEAHIRRELPHLVDDDVRELALVIERLITVVRPERVYLFGSQARGTATLRSDIDLLVVVRQSDLPPHRRDQVAYQAIGWHTLSLDILVLTQEEFEHQLGVAASLPAIVLREGHKLYDAA